jgi:hypothetical protein
MTDEHLVKNSCKMIILDRLLASVKMGEIAHP